MIRSMAEDESTAEENLARLVLGLRSQGVTDAAVLPGSVLHGILLER